jgi:hypothetical protein
MAVVDRIYHRTQAGTQAATLAGSGLPPSIRALLRAFGPATHVDELAVGYEGEDVVARLDDLEAIGLVESIPAEWLVELLEI